jgi:GT2 family glycosyltransferase
MAASVRTQVVLYRNSPATALRLGKSIAACARLAKRRGEADHVELALGDSSPDALLTAADVAAFTRDLTAGGLDRVEYDFFGANLGSAGGSNRLAAEADAEFLWIVNPDAYPAPPALLKLLGAMSKPEVAIADARQIPIEHPKAHDHGTGETSWASGFCSLIRRSAFTEVGGFDDDNFLLHCDDVDLSWRVRLAGFKVVHVPDAVVFHDLTVDREGRIVASRPEEYHGALGRLILAHKYNRRDVIDETVATILESGSLEQKRALTEFQGRELDGALPAPLQDTDGVAQFIRGEYAYHRF